MCMHRCDSPLKRTANARLRETSARYILHSPRKKVQAQGKSPLCLLPETEKKSLLKGKTPHAREHTYTHIHFERNIGFHHASFRTSFRNETEKLSARKEFNRISLDCSFFHCRGTLRPPHLLLKLEKFAGLNRRQNSSRQLPTLKARCPKLHRVISSFPLLIAR